MDPLTIAVAAATVVLTKMLEKTGETMGETAMEAGGKLLDMLRRKSPDTVAKLEQAAEQQALPEGPEIIDAEILEELEQLANQDPEVKASVEATTDAAPEVKANIEAVANEAGVMNANKLADTINKLGIVNQLGGRIENVTLNL